MDSRLVVFLRDHHHPAGNPSLTPQGIVSAGCGVMWKAAVLANISCARWMTSVRGASGGGIGVAVQARPLK